MSTIVKVDHQQVIDFIEELVSYERHDVGHSFVIVGVHPRHGRVFIVDSAIHPPYYVLID